MTEGLNKNVDIKFNAHELSVQKMLGRFAF